MIIQIDTREHKGKNDHIIDFLDLNKIKWIRSKLVVGDYMNIENPRIVVDRKFGLQEVAQNLTSDHERFRRECELAKELGYRLIVLIEEENINRIEKVPTWYNFRKKYSPKAISGKQLHKIMITMTDRYGVEWKFSTRQNYGRKLVELLERCE